MSWLHWSLLSAVFAAATAVLAKFGVAGVDPNFATAIRTSVVVVFTWALTFIGAASSDKFNVPTRAWVFLVLSGIATGLSWVCYFHALQAGPASKVAPVDKLSVVGVILLSALFLGEPLTPVKLTGGSLIALGAVLLALE